MAIHEFGGNLNIVSGDLRNTAHTLVNYGARHRKGLPISSIAESAVNQVVGHRMAKKRQMRWTDEGAHESEPNRGRSTHAARRVCSCRNPGQHGKFLNREFFVENSNSVPA
jgi:hypothetical protein